MKMTLLQDPATAKPLTKVAEYRGIPIQRTCMAMWAGGLEFPRILCAPTGGGGWWGVASLEEAQLEIDKACAQGGKPADWTYTPKSLNPPAGSDKISLSAEKLIQIAGRSAARVISLSAAVSDPILQVEKGWPLLSWVVDGVAGCTRFTRLSDDGHPQVQVVFINAPEADRAKFDDGEYPLPTTVVMIGA